MPTPPPTILVTKQGLIPCPQEVIDKNPVSQVPNKKPLVTPQVTAKKSQTVVMVNAQKRQQRIKFCSTRNSTISKASAVQFAFQHSFVANPPPYSPVQHAVNRQKQLSVAGNERRTQFMATFLAALSSSAHSLTRHTRSSA